MKSCSRYHGPILPVDSVDEGSGSAASQQASSSMAVDCNDISQENDQVVDPQAASNQGCSDTDMKGILRHDLISLTKAPVPISRYFEFLHSQM